MPDLSWHDAIVEALRGSAEPMHYADIAELIAERQLRSEFGATPAKTVNAVISISIQDAGDESPFVRMGRGIYGLRGHEGQLPAQEVQPEEAAESTGLINAFGMYWARANVLWTSAPRILGQQQPGSTPVNFCNQRGVYLLHDGRAVVYVGRTTDQPLGIRLRQHTIDRLNGRWDRFSWFGVHRVSPTGDVEPDSDPKYDLEMLIATMEALLIEGLEPPQNRKRGDDFKAVEFLQARDPEIEKQNVLTLIEDLKRRF